MESFESKELTFYALELIIQPFTSPNRSGPSRPTLTRSPLISASQIARNGHIQAHLGII